MKASLSQTRCDVSIVTLSNHQLRRGALMTARSKQRPEALAQFAETARNDRGEDRPGLVADAATAPLPTDSDAKDEAATKVLQEGVTGEDHGAAEAIERLPDRI